MVSAARSALRIDSSVACTVASKNAFIFAFAINSTRALSGASAVLGLAVENATKMSPEELAPNPPVRPIPSETRLASRLN